MSAATSFTRCCEVVYGGEFLVELNQFISDFDALITPFSTLIWITVFLTFGDTLCEVYYCLL